MITRRSTSVAAAQVRGPGTNGSFAGFGVAYGKVCVVVISRSIVQGVTDLETMKSIERFRTIIEELLDHE
jgi:hypothetical protein